MHLALCTLGACALAVAAAAALRRDSNEASRTVAAIGGDAASASDSARADQLLGRVPAAFVPNLGQWGHEARYVARLGPVTAFLEERGWWLSLVQHTDKPRDRRDPRAMRAVPEDPPSVRSASVRMTFAGSDQPELVAEERLAGVHNYFLGNDAARWRTGVPRYAAVRYRSLYPGVDVRAYEKDGHLEYDLVLAPGADLARVEVHVEGADALRLDEQSALVFETAAGALHQPRPVSYAIDAGGARHEVACVYELRGKDRFGFTVAGWDGGCELVLDPGLVYSTFLGGFSHDYAVALSVDAAGVATVVGNTESTDFPTTPGGFAATFGGLDDAFVARLDPSLPSAQQLVYSTFLGGSSFEEAYTLWVDAAGVATVAGKTHSPDFPTTPGAWDTTFSGGDAFVARLDPSLPGAQQLVYSTFLGGGLDEFIFTLSVDDAGVATVAGNTSSADFPTIPGAWDRTFGGGASFYGGDAFVARLDLSLPSAQQLVYSTFLGGSGDDGAYALSVDAAGVATVAGSTGSPDFPTTPGAWDTTFGGGGDTFVARLDPALSGAQQLVYSTFLGGLDGDGALALSVSAAGVATVAGVTRSLDFPTTSGAWDRTFGGASPLYSSDAFLSRLDPSLPGAQQLVYSTFLGGSSYDLVRALSVDAAGVATVAGETHSSDFPTTSGAWDTVHGGRLANDAFVARLDPSLPGPLQLIYSTFLGGSLHLRGGRNTEVVNALSVDAAGVTTVAGETASPAFPTTPGAWDTTHNDGSDAFLARLDLLPTGARTFGASSPGCNGPLAIGVTSMPRIGNATFTITCNNAPPLRSGAMLLAARGLASPIGLLGVQIWLDPSSAWFVALPTSSTQTGGAYFSFPLPNDLRLIGLQFDAQFLWFGSAAPSPCPPLGLSASNALEVTIQP